MVRSQVLLLFLCFPVVRTDPVAHKNSVFPVLELPEVLYAQGVQCKHDSMERYDAHTSEELPIPPTPSCPQPTVVNLTLDVYLPDDGPQNSTGNHRPAFVAIHSGGYASNNESGYKNEMRIACEHFASRGFVAITMNYRLTNAASGSGLAPANWSGIPSPLKSPSWQGGFNPTPQRVYAAVRDTKAAIRWLRAHAASLRINTTAIGAGGWSAGACTTVHLATTEEWDFTTEMNATTDPTFLSISDNMHLSSKIKAGVVWAGNAAVTDMKDALDGGQRFRAPNAPLAMYRGSDDTVMTPWAQLEVQRKFNASGVRCDLHLIQGVGHSSLFPQGNVSANMPVLNHSYLWLSRNLGVNLV
eukprot:m.297279 g.297279  ORF g.297279 m.297279 type:complete len:357 (-) comp20077_c0_seq7:2508-3578(-)